jgi:hypothetical protein
MPHIGQADPTLAHRNSTGRSGVSSPHRPSDAVTAVFAGLLWAAQALIWTVGPKVQAAYPPYQVTNRPLFMLFWLAIAGAVFCSAAAMGGVLSRVGRPSRLRTAGRVGAVATYAGSATAGAAALLAGTGVAEATCISVMSNALNGAACALLLTTALVAIVVARSHLFRSWQAALPSLLAGLTLLTLVAIMASGSKAQTGLIFAVAVVAASGATWLLLGRTL